MGEIAEPMDDNEALRRILASVENLQSGLLAPYSITGDNEVEVSDTPFEIESDPDIVKRVITNLGDEKITIKEGGVIVGIAYKDQTWSSDLLGNKLITIYCETGKTSTAAIANYAKTAS